MSTADDKTKVKNEDSPTIEQILVLGMFGIFVVLPVSFLGGLFSLQYFGSATMAYVGGFSFVLAIVGTLGYFTVLIKQSIREVTIRVIQEQQ